MHRRTYLFFLVLSVLCVSAGWAESPIKQLENIPPKDTAFDLRASEKPLVITSLDQAAKYFDDKNLANLRSKVDFSKQEVLLFVWRGSGQDRLDYTVLESFPEQIRFRYQRGFTRDLRRHFRVFIVRRNVECSVNGKPVERPASELEIKVNGDWTPAKMPLPGLARGKSVKVKVHGTLTHGVIAIGGETTGTTIRFGRTTWELDLRKERAFASDAERLNGQRVVVTGTLANQQGIETGKRQILTVDSLKSSVH